MRRLLSRRVTVTQAVIALGGLVAYLSLLSSGDVVTGLGVLVACAVVVGALNLVSRRRFPARTERLEESAILPHTCEAVWQVIKPAATAHLIEPTIRQAYRVPGTPDGLGERQAFEQHDGSTVVIEVIEYEENRGAVTRQVSPRIIAGHRSGQAVEPVEGGCKYSRFAEVDLKVGQRMAAGWEQRWRSATKAHTARVLAVLDSSSSGSTALPQPPEAP